jgi:hypothetical protein
MGVNTHFAYCDGEGTQLARRFNFALAVGGIFVIIGVSLWILGAVARPVAGRRYH